MIMGGKLTVFENEAHGKPKVIQNDGSHGNANLGECLRISIV